MNLHYTVKVETPLHGRIFFAECGSSTIAAVLATAAREVEVRSFELHQRRVPVKFDVVVRP